MRTCIILTGALRTIKKTMSYHKKHLIREGVDVILCVQNDTQESNDSWTNWFYDQFGSHLISIEWFAIQDHQEWIAHRETQLKNMIIGNNWKDYLRHSGSMIEYFQLQLAYMKMCHYEQIGGFQYDYIVRARTDSIYAKPIDFHWLYWTEEEIRARVVMIKEELQLSKIPITDQSVLTYFMTTIISDDVIPNIERILAEYSPCETEWLPHETETMTYQAALWRYLHYGRYILTLRKNNLYIVRRNLFHMIPTLGTMYGFLRAPNSDDYWFNAEGQFRSACYYACLSVFDYSTLYEDRSVAHANEWNEADFFDLDGGVLNPAMLYCVVRK
uniref:Uncharacterized protein n=1 Tax=viral metagenome TaxID=1070528 RepID=A0A6C0KTQ2_9ZZZZ